VGSGRDLHHAPATPFVRDLFRRLEDQVDEVGRLLQVSG
jgi:hypothetical protein